MPKHRKEKYMWYKVKSITFWIILIICFVAGSLLGGCVGNKVAEAEYEAQLAEQMIEEIPPVELIILEPEESAEIEPIDEESLEDAIAEPEPAEEPVEEEEVIEEVEEEPVVEENTPPTTNNPTSLSDEEYEILAKLLYCEARGMTWEGQVYTCSAILNLSDHSGRTIWNMAHDANIFSPASFVDTVTPLQTQYDVIDYVCSGGRIADICWFRTGHYHSFGTPVCEVDGHYFSKP